MTSFRRAQKRQGFTLVEMLISLGIGGMMLMTVAQLLILHERAGSRIADVMRERHNHRRTLTLIRSEIQQADRVETDPSRMAARSCSLAGRTPVLQLSLPQGSITYSVGAPPSSIWLGQVLMRCGPAYGLDGTLSTGNAQNRVLIDRLAIDGFKSTKNQTGNIDLSISGTTAR